MSAGKGNLLSIRAPLARSLVLGRYVRDEKVLTLPEAIRKMTSLTADFLRLYDRGRIQTGMAADITIFDANKVRDTSTWKTPQALSEGIVHVIINGQFALKNGVATGSTTGKIHQTAKQTAGGEFCAMRVTRRIACGATSDASSVGLINQITAYRSDYGS